MQETRCEVASEEKQDEFKEKLEQDNLLPVETVITVRAVEFVDMTEFNNSRIKAEDFKQEKELYISKNSKSSTIELIVKDVRKRLEDIGLYPEQCSIKQSSWLPFLNEFIAALTK